MRRPTSRTPPRSRRLRARSARRCPASTSASSTSRASSSIVAGRAEDTPPPERIGEPLRIGVLAIQGDFEAHGEALRRLGADAVEVRRADQLAGLDGLVIPGGESTTISMGLESYGLEQPIRDFVEEGRAVFGTCAGLIVLDRAHLGLMD